MNDNAVVFWLFPLFLVFSLIIFFELFFVQDAFFFAKEKKTGYLLLKANSRADKTLFSVDGNGLAETDSWQKRILFNVIKKMPLQEKKENCFFVERIVFFKGKTKKVFFNGCEK